MCNYENDDAEGKDCFSKTVNRLSFHKGQIPTDIRKRLLHVWNNTNVIQYTGITELDKPWNRNTAVLLYNQLSGHGERKLLAHMIDPYYNLLWCCFQYKFVFSNLLSCLFNWLRLVQGWFRFRPVLHNTFCVIIARKMIFAFASQFQCKLKLL